LESKLGYLVWFKQVVPNSLIAKCSFRVKRAGPAQRFAAKLVEMSGKTDVFAPIFCKEKRDFALAIPDMSVRRRNLNLP
jgi:hypothetical protein